MDNNEQHLALLGRFVIAAPSIDVQSSDLLTYLKYHDVNMCTKVFPLTRMETDGRIQRKDKLALL